MAALISLFIGVILRYGFNYSLAWSEELVREVIIVTTFIGCSAAIKARAMVKVDALIQLVPVTKYPIMFISNLVTLLFSGMMIYYGWKLVIMQAATNQTTIILEIPLELLYAILPIMGIHDVHSHDHGDASGLASMAKGKSSEACLALFYETLLVTTETRQTMDSAHLIILGVLLGGMATLVPVGMCLFFTACCGFSGLYESPPADAGPEHLQEHGQLRPGGGALFHPVRQHHDRRNDRGQADQVCPRPGELAPRRPRHGRVPGLRHVRRHLRFHGGHHGGPGRVHDPGPDQEQVSRRTLPSAS